MSIVHSMDLTWHIAPGSIFTTFHHLLALGKIGATRCARCNSVYLPPRPACGDCYEPLSEWVHVADSGTIEAFTVSHYPIMDPVTGKPRPTPYASLLIKLDGASTSLNHYLVDSDPNEAGIGRRVKAVWRTPRNTLKDLLGFVITDEKANGSYPRPLDPSGDAFGQGARIRVDLNIPFAYAFGKAGGWFFEGLRRAEIMASRCQPCSEVRVPCRSFCPVCFRPLGKSDLIPVGPGGTLVACCGSERGTLGLIRLDGTDNLFLHFAPRARRGSRVAARFKPVEQRRGHLLDLEYFERAGPSS